ncbi:MAG: DUF3108 domain-containing protein [bacterium]
MKYIKTILCLLFLSLLISFSNAYTIKIGEKLIYKIKILNVSVGTQILHVVGINQINNKETYKIFYELKSSDFLNRFYNLHDIIYVNMDKQTFHPIQIEKKIKEGKYENHVLAKFNFEEKKVYVREKNREFTKDLLPSTFDFISIVYYMRNQNLKVGKKFRIGMFGGREITSNVITVEGKEKIKIPFGTFETIVIVQKPEALKIWFTNDADCIPVKIEVQLKYGYLSAVLDKVVKE